MKMTDQGRFQNRLTGGDVEFSRRAHIITTATSTHEVLIVEDDADFRDAVSRLLEEEGCTVRVAGNGAEALELLKKAERPPCVILLDLMMPVMNGWQFLEQKKTQDDLSEIPVVVMSAYLDMPGFAAPHLPVQATLKKPLDLNHLLEAVDQHCASRNK